MAHYRPPTQEKVRVANCSEPFLTGYFLEKTADRRQRFVAVEPEDYPHIFLATTRFECHKSREGRALHIVTRQATPLLYVIEVQSPQ